MADEPDEEVRFEKTSMRREMTASFSSWVENWPRPEEDPLDFSVYMDEVCRLTASWTVSKRSLQAPLTIQDNSPLPLVHQFFVKLGARYVIVANSDGNCEYLLLSKDETDIEVMIEIR